MQAKVFLCAAGRAGRHRTAKKDLCLEQFRRRNERLVNQEVYGNWTLITMIRLFANRSE